MRRLLAQLTESSAAFRDVFHNPALRRLQLAWAGSIFGTWAYGIAVVVYAYDQGGAKAVGIVGLARWIPAAIVSPFAALLGDRYDRRLVMVVSDLARAALIGAAAAAVILDSSPIVVYVLATLVGLVATAFRPAQAALTPTLARTPEELTAANVVASTIESVGIFGGPAIGGLLLAATGTSTVFIVTAAMLVWSAVLLVGIRPAADVDELTHEPGSVGDELLAGFRTIGGDRRLRLLVGLFSAQTFVDGMLNVLIVVIAIEYLDAGDGAVGYLNSAVGIGGLLGAAVAAGLIARKRLAGDFGLGIFIWGVPIALIALWQNEVYVFLLLAVVGIGNTIVDVSGMTLLQRSAPEEVLSRVFGVLESVLLLTVGLGAVVAPFLLDWLGTRGALIAAGALLPLLVVPSWATLQRIDRAAHVPVVQLELLHANQIFAPLPATTLEQLADALDEVKVAEGEVVFEQGTPGDRFYLVAEGEIEVLVDGRPAEWLGPEDSFGEVALLRDVPRTATVRAKTDAVLYALERREFLAAVTGFGPSLSAAEAVIGMRLGPARAGLVRA